MSRKSDHVTPLLIELPWLPVKQSFDRFVGRSVSHSVSQSISQSVKQLVSQSVRQSSVSQSINQSNNPAYKPWTYTSSKGVLGGLITYSIIQTRFPFTHVFRL